VTDILHQGPGGIIDALTYQYDAVGNRTSLTRSNGTASLLPSDVASASYDAANEQTAFAGATLTYDANGNLTNDGVNTYQWDARNRLTGISGGSTATFNYDVLGRRTSKAVGSLTSQFLYDGNDIAAEIGGGAVGANYLRSLTIDEPFIRQTGTGNEFYHTDALGSALALSDGQGASATTYGYEPFGKTTVTGTSSNAFQYTGREQDGTGLYYYRARYYQPRLTRFISEDPIGLRGGDPNLYGYVGQNPILRTDPSGHNPSATAIILGCGLGAVSGAIGAKKPVQGAIVGGLIGCGLGTLVSLEPGAPSIILGGYLGGLGGAAVAGAQSGGDPNAMKIGAVSGLIGGSVGGGLGGGIGILAGSTASIMISQALGLFDSGLHTSVPDVPGPPRPNNIFGY